MILSCHAYYVFKIELHYFRTTDFNIYNRNNFFIYTFLHKSDTAIAFFIEDTRNILRRSISYQEIFQK